MGRICIIVIKGISRKIISAYGPNNIFVRLYDIFGDWVIKWSIDNLKDILKEGEIISIKSRFNLHNFTTPFYARAHLLHLK